MHLHSSQSQFTLGLSPVRASSEIYESLINLKINVFSKCSTGGASVKRELNKI